MLVEHPAQVRAMADRVRPWSRGVHGTVALRLPGLSAEENLVFQNRLNALLDACGCGTGGVLSVVAAAPVVLAALSGASWIAGVGPLTTLGFALLAFLVGGAVGKALGLAHAHLRLKRTLEELLRRATA